jgi:hypothetical protein
MNYFTGLATSPVFEFPFSSFQTHSVPSHDNDINAILAVCRTSFNQLNENQTVFTRVLHHRSVLKFTISLKQSRYNVFRK